MTWDQCRTWRDSRTLWTHALTHGAGESSEVHNNLGVELSRQGKFEAATAHYTEALRLNPRYADAHNNLGVVLSRQGKFEAAAAHYAEALRLKPGYVAAHNNLGVDLSTRVSSRRRRLISPRRCGSIPTMSPHTTTWSRPRQPG